MDDESRVQTKKGKGLTVSFMCFEGEVTFCVLFTQNSLKHLKIPEWSPKFLTGKALAKWHNLNFFIHGPIILRTIHNELRLGSKGQIS